MADEGSTYYAWSEIQYGAEVDKETKGILSIKSIPVGEQVDAGKLDLTEDQFQELVDSGAVRTMEFPEQLRAEDRSPIQMMFEIHELTSGNLAAGYFAPEAMAQLQTAAESTSDQEEEITSHEESKVTNITSGQTTPAGT